MGAVQSKFITYWTRQEIALQQRSTVYHCQQQAQIATQQDRKLHCNNDQQFITANNKHKLLLNKQV